MKTSFYKRHNEGWFCGKVAITLCDLTNNGGGKIPAGSEVELRYKCGGAGGFAICFKDIHITQVSPSLLNLKDGDPKYHTEVVLIPSQSIDN